MDFTLYWFMFPVAICVATCAMLAGIGGAALFTPIFVLIFPLLGPDYPLESTAAAIGTALVTQTFGFLSGFIAYARRRLIDYTLARQFLRVSAPVALIGAVTANFAHDGVLIASYAVLVFALAAAIWWRTLAPAATQKQGTCAMRTLIDAAGTPYRYPSARPRARDLALTGAGAFLTGMVSVGIGEVTVAQLARRDIPAAVAAATSVMVVIGTVAVASITLLAQLIQTDGWSSIPWILLIYTVPGVLIGGQIGPRLQGRVSELAMRGAISVLFAFLAVAMMSVAYRKLDGL